MPEEKAKEVDYTLNNPETINRYKTATQISEKVLAAVSELCVPGAKIVELCQQGDKLLAEEVDKVFRGKKMQKGLGHPTTVSPRSFVTPYTPLVSDEQEANVEIQPGEPIKIQLGAQIDGFASIVCNTIIARPKENADDEITGRDADLLLATHYCHELLLRLMLPPGTLAVGTDEEKAKAAAIKAPTQARMNQLLEKVAKTFDCNIVEGTTTWLFDRFDIEGKKKIVLAPGEGARGEGTPEIGEVWGVEVGISAGSGKLKKLPQRATLHRRTNMTYGLKRPSSRKILGEATKKFYTFPFSLRQLDDERDAKLGAIECVRGNVFRQYEVWGEKDGAAVARLWSTIAITKNGISKMGAPPPLDLNKVKSDKKIEDEEILEILGRPLMKNTGNKKNKNKKKNKSGKKTTKASTENAEAAEDDAEEDDAEE